MEMSPLQTPVNPEPDISGSDKEIQANGIPSPIRKVRMTMTSALFLYVKKGNLERLKSALLKTKKPLLKEKDETGKTILHYAVEFRKIL